MVFAVRARSGTSGSGRPAGRPSTGPPALHHRPLPIGQLDSRRGQPIGARLGGRPDRLELPILLLFLRHTCSIIPRAPALAPAAPASASVVAATSVRCLVSSAGAGAAVPRVAPPALIGVAGIADPAAVDDPGLPDSSGRRRRIGIISIPTRGRGRSWTGPAPHAVIPPSSVVGHFGLGSRIFPRSDTIPSRLDGIVCPSFQFGSTFWSLCASPAGPSNCRNSAHQIQIPNDDATSLPRHAARWNDGRNILLESGGGREVGTESSRAVRRDWHRS